MIRVCLHTRTAQTANGVLLATLEKGAAKVFLCNKFFSYGLTTARILVYNKQTI